MKRQIVLSSICLSVFLAGCSKSSPKEEAVVGPDGVPVDPKAAAKLNPAFASDLNKIASDVQNKKYDEAITAIAVMKEMPKSEKEQIEYMSKVNDVSQQLYQQGQNDPAAMERYRALGKIMMGR